VTSTQYCLFTLSMDLLTTGQDRDWQYQLVMGRYQNFNIDKPWWAATWHIIMNTGHE